MNISFNDYKSITVPKVVLCYPNKKRICILNAKEKKSELYAAGVSSFAFSIYKYHENIENKGFDDISVGKYIWLQDIGWYRITDISRKDDSYNPKLEVTCYDLVCELKQTYLTSFGSMGTEDDEQGGLDRYALYDAGDTSHSIAHIFMDKNPGWKFKYIDPEIAKGRRSFNNDSVTSSEFLTTDVADAFECIFKFDSNDRSVSAYKAENLGKQVPIVLSFRNLVKELNISWNEDDIKTMLNVTGGNDASGTPLSIASVNPSGNNYITNFSYFYDDMSNELKAKLEEYYDLMDSSNGKIATAMSQLKVLQDDLSDLNNKMPTNESSTMWSEYGLVGLKAKATTYKEQMSVLTDAIASDTVAQNQYNNYNSLWNAVTAEITVRQNQITTKENQIKAKQSEVQSYVINMADVLGEDLYLELQPFRREGNLCDTSYIATSVMTDNDVLEMKQDLYNHGVEELNKVCYPQFDMTVSSVNFPVLFKYKEWTKQLEIGDVLVIKYSDSDFIKARLLVMELDWEDFKNFKLTFSSKSSITTGWFPLNDMQKMVNRNTGTLKYNKSGWNQASKQANEAYYNTNLKKFLDLSMQQIQSNATDQEVTIDNTGALFTKKDASEKLWITNRQILLFDEPVGTNLKEPKIAIGMIEVNQNDVVTKAYGIGAELLLGKIVIAENLYIQNKNNTLTMGADGFKAKALNGFSVQINPDDPNNIFNISKDDEKFFYIDAESKKLVFRGYAEIDEGKIGGWDIAKDKLSSGGVGMSSDATTGAVAFWAGNENANLAPFRVTNQGKLNASDVNITGGSLSIGNGFKVDSSGRLTAQSVNIKNGNINIGDVFEVSEDGVSFGDYYVSADGSNVLRSTDGTVVIQTAKGGPFGKYAAINLSSQAGTTILSDHHLETPFVNAKQINGDCELFGDNWWRRYTLFEALDYLYNQIENLKS